MTAGVRRRRAAAALRPAALLPAALLVAAGCQTSPDPRLVARGESAFGAYVTVGLRDGRQQVGELLALHDSALVLLAANRVVVGRLADVARVDWGGASPSDVVDARGGLSPGRRRQVRLASRFPYGLPDPGLQSLLASLRQAAPDTLRVAPR